jgi:iron complex transport system permease protein
MSNQKLRVPTFLLLLVGAWLLSGVFSLALGASGISLTDTMQALWAHLAGKGGEPSQAETIIWQLRLPRGILALLVGAALALSGALMQSLFHNPLADPYIAGVSSGAAFGAVAIGCLGMQSDLFFTSTLMELGALAGALAAAFAVFALARRAGRVPVGTLLLTGIALSAFLQAITSFMLLRQAPADTHDLLLWLMGSLADATWKKVFLLLPVVLIGSFVVYAWRRELDVLALGDETAHYLGVNTERMRMILLALAALLASSAVAAGGIIAFVGLIVPHLLRPLAGSSHRLLLPACFFGGGLLLLWADVAARLLITGCEVPIGLVTSVIGGVFFLYLLRGRMAA